MWVVSEGWEVALGWVPLESPSLLLQPPSPQARGFGSTSRKKAPKGYIGCIGDIVYVCCESGNAI